MPKKKQQTQQHQQPAQTNERSQLSTERFRKSDRLQMALAGTRNRFGASCNTFLVGDSIASIAEAHSWALHVSHMQGAPSLHYGLVRPRGSIISTGGVSGGVVPFMHIFDANVTWIKRDTYKKGAGIAWLPWHHDDLDEFLAADFQSIYRGVLIPGNHEPKEQELFLESPQFEKLVQAYEKGKCFICKEPEPSAHSGEALLLNLCTEVEIPHLGACVLGVQNLSLYTPENIRELPEDFRQSALSMLKDSRVSRNLQSLYPALVCNSPANVQFGLGVSGLASMLANWDVSYLHFTEALEALEGESILDLAFSATTLEVKNQTKASTIVRFIALAYSEATWEVKPYVCKAFCVQPSATGAYECADASGYHSSPELQPVTGIRDEHGVHTIRKSQLKGDAKVTFHPRTATLLDVPYEVYRRLCCAWQRLLDSTGLAHRHSACYYGEEFQGKHLQAFVESNQKSLYYRLPQYNPEALDKSRVGEGLDFAEDFSVEALLLGSCSVQAPNDMDCGCGG